MRKLAFLIVILLSCPILAQNVNQIRSDASVIYGEGVSATPSKADELALKALLNKLVKTSVLDGSASQKEKFWETYYADVRSVSSVLFEGKTALRYIRWDAIGKIFDARRKKVLDLLQSASNALTSGRNGIAITYLDWAETYIETLPESGAEKARMEELRTAAGDAKAVPVNMKHIIRETAMIRQILGAQSAPEPVMPVVIAQADAPVEKPLPKEEKNRTLDTKLGNVASIQGQASVSGEHVPTGSVNAEDVAEYVAGCKLYYRPSKPSLAFLLRAQIGSPITPGIMGIYRSDDYGFYASFMMTPSSVKSSYNCTSDGESDYGYIWSSGKEKKKLMLVSAGFVARMSKSFEGYIGAGYGQSNVFWEDTSAKWAKVTDKSHSGLFCEGGVIISFDRVSFSAGIGSVSFKTLIPIIGLGISF